MFHSLFWRRLGMGVSCVLLLIGIIFPSAKTRAADSTAQWVIEGSMTTPRIVQGATLLQDGRVLVTAGAGTHSDFLSTSEIYDPRTRTWSPTGNIHQVRLLWVSPGMVTLPNGKVLVAAGEGPAGVTDLGSTEIYDPGTGSWTYAASVNIPRRQAVLAPLPNGKVLLASGSHGPPVSSRFITTAEVYDPTTNTWTTTGDMRFGRDGDRFVVLADGRVLVAGGESTRASAENTAEIYDPTTGQWTMSTMPFAMRQGTLTLLHDGRVLLAGGFNGSQVVASTALYDPRTNTWASAAPMATARAGQQAILLSDGKVLVFGGNNFGTFYNTSEIYDPATDTWTAGPSLPTNMSLGVVIKLHNGDYLAFGGSDGSTVLSATYVFTCDKNPRLSILRSKGCPI